MKALLKADFLKLRKSPLIYVLFALALTLPAISTAFIYGMASYFADGDLGLLLGVASERYAYSFNLLSNIGLLTIIFTTLIVAQDFTQFTIRNKIIAGYSRTKIYVNILIVNLTIAFGAMILNSGGTYAVALIFEGFTVSEFLNVLKFAAIGFSGLFVLISFHTLLLFHFKKVAGALLVTLGLIFAILFLQVIFDFISIYTTRELPVMFYAVPLIRLVMYACETFKDWYWALFANIVHLGYLIPLSILLANKTDFN